MFAHGLFADGSCYSKVIPALLAERHEVLSAQNSLDSLKGDVAAVTRALGRVSSPAILVGHSWGGAVITAAGTDHRVAGLVYIAALAPDEGETGQGLLGRYPTELFKHLAVAEGRVWMLCWRKRSSATVAPSSNLAESAVMRAMRALRSFCDERSAR